MPSRTAPVRQRGIAALEFAMVAPLVILVILAALEIMTILMVDTRLEAAAYGVERDVRLNWSAGQNCEAQIANGITQRLGSWWLTGNPTVQQLASYPRAADLPPVDPAALPCSDAPSGLVTYQIDLENAGILGVLNALGTDTFRLRRVIAIRNAP